MEFSWQDLIVFSAVGYVIFCFARTLFKRKGKGGACAMGCGCVNDIKKKLK